MINMTREDLQKVIEEAITQAFFKAGLRIDEEDHIEESRKDFVFVRRLRGVTESAATKIGWGVIALVGGGLWWIVTWVLQQKGFKP